MMVDRLVQQDELKVQVYPTKRLFGNSYKWDTITRSDIISSLVELGSDKQLLLKSADEKLLALASSYLPSNDYLQKLVSYGDSLDSESITAIENYIEKKNVRAGSREEALIHQAIVKAPRTEKPFVVSRVDTLGDKGNLGSHIHNEFLSTNIKWEGGFGPEWRGEYDDVLIIEVPIGTPCLYIPTKKRQVLFDINMTINIIGKYKDTLHGKDSDFTYTAILSR